VRPWGDAIIRWLTSRSVLGNGAALVRQEGQDGGAGVSAIIDPRAEYLFEVLVHLPGKGGGFGTPQDTSTQIMASVMDADGRILGEAPVPLVAGDWAPGRVAFESGAAREVRCVIHAKAPKRLPCLYFAEGFRLTRKDRAWWNPENLFNASRTAARLPDDRDLLLRTLEPDVVGGHNGVYLNWDGFFTRRGIAVGGGHWEQEYNHLAAEDAAIDRFAKNGMAKNVSGETLRGDASRLWPGFNMCHNAPTWHSYYRQQFKRVAPEVDLLSQDNICTPSFLAPGKGCFCQDCRDGFREWIAQRPPLLKQETADIRGAASDIVAHVRGAQATIAKGGDAVLADAVLRAYIQFSYASQADRWRDAVTAAREAAGHTIAVCGNQWGAGGQRPYSVALSQIGDMIFTEAEADCLAPQARAESVLATKLGLAAGAYRRPVLLCLSSLFHAPQAANCRLRSVAAQAWADGGRPTPWATAPKASGWFYDTEARLCRFVQQHRALFTRRDRVANVGLVYSLPTHAWRHFPAFGLSSTRYQRWFAACARLLEENHVPYEVNCWWHPLLGDDAPSLRRLDRYHLLVLPGVDCLTKAQRTAIRAFQERGGRIIHIPLPTLRDADALPLPPGETVFTDGELSFEFAADALTRYAQTGDKRPPSNDAAGRAATDELRTILTRAMAKNRILDADSPPDVWSSLWLDETRQLLALHMVNGHIDTDTDQFRPVEGSRWRVRLPDGLFVDKAVIVSPDAISEPDTARPVPVAIADGWATIVIPRIESYAVAVLFGGGTLANLNREADQRRKAWRARIAPGH